MNSLRDFIALLLAAFLLAACTNDDLLTTDGEGRLRVAMPNVSATTRAVPADLGIPTPEDFQLRITNSAGRAVYDGAFTAEELTLPTGNYSVRATYGTNPLLGLDTPYYIAESNATITEGQTTSLNMHATVGNALVSAVFGRDEEELARFERFYSDYALRVHIGNFSAAITREKPEQSIYVRAGQHATLSFWGKLKLENGREVEMTLESSDFPATLTAADHAIVTLSLPEPESALTVDISKVALESVTLEETIPLSWLPVPQVTPTHRYAANGNLVGTDLTFSDSYVGMNWRTVVTDAASTEVRRVQGTGELTSAYTTSTTWPYLPQGKYKATYYIVSTDGTAKIASSREFIVPAPSLAITLGGYTSYSKYLEGDIEAANACQRLTIYEPSVRLSVDNTLLQNSNYAYSFSYSYEGAAATAISGNTYFLGNITGQSVRQTPYTLQASATFDGVAVTAKKEFQITGLPYSLNLKDHGEWDSSGGVDWFDNDVRLGHLSTGGQYIRTGIAICLPPSTYFCADYNVNVHTLTVGTTFSIDVGTNHILSIEEAGTPFNDKDHLHEGTTATFHDDNQWTTSIQCNNSYGAGQTCSHIYALTLKYATH